jgi:hypothetical protein
MIKGLLAFLTRFNQPLKEAPEAGALPPHPAWASRTRRGPGLPPSGRISAVGFHSQGPAGFSLVVANNQNY